MDFLTHDMGARPILVSSLRRDPGPHDLPALAWLVRELPRVRPPSSVTHHTPRRGRWGGGGHCGCPPGRRPVLGAHLSRNSWPAYFSGVAARPSPHRGRSGPAHRPVIAVSEEVFRSCGDGRRAQGEFEVVRLGSTSPASWWTATSGSRGAGRRRAELESRRCPVVTLVARLVAIKRVDASCASPAGWREPDSGS